jgi:hypothetical protein
LESAFQLVKDLATRGPIALWERVESMLSNLKEMIFPQVTQLVLTEIIKAAVVKLVSMLNPAGALIQAVLAIYRVVKFFLNWWETIKELVRAILDTITSVALGQIDKAANFIEKVMAKGMKLVIAFLARVFGLGGIAAKVKKLIDKIGAPVRKAIGKVIDWIVGKAKKLFGKVKAVGKKAIVKVLKFFGVKEKFATEKGESHSIYYQKKGSRVVLMVSSSPKSIREFLNYYEDEYDIKEGSSKWKLLKETRKFISSDIDPLINQLKKARREKDSKQENDIQGKLLNKNVTLSKMLKRLFGRDRRVGMIIDSYKLEGLVGTYASIPQPVEDILTPDHQPQAAILGWAAEQPYFGETGNLAKRAARRAAKGYAINLHENRHTAGRTFGSKGGKTKSDFVTFVEDKIRQEEAGTNQKKREVVVDRIKWELDEDVNAMKKVVGKNKKHKVWADIRVLDIGDKEKDGLVKMIRSNIERGEDQIANQDLDSLK